MTFFRKLAATLLSTHSHKVRQQRQRALYRKTHDELAARYGIVIPWARKR